VSFVHLSLEIHFRYLSRSIERPRVTVQWLSLLLHIEEVPVPIMGLETHYTVFRCFPQYLE